MKEVEAVKPTRKLNMSQTLFAQEYAISRNATQAYKKVYDADMSDAAASSSAYNLLRITEIRTEVRRVWSSALERNGVTLDNIVKELSALGFSNIQNVFDLDFEPKDLLELEPRIASAIEMAQKTVTTSENGSNTIVKVKMHNKLAALDRLIEMGGFIKKEGGDINITGDKVQVIFK